MGEIWEKVSGLRKAWVVVALGAFVAAMALSAGPASASCDMWNGSVNTDWFNSSNWSGGVPASGTDACIPPSSGTVLIDGLTEASSSAAAANTVTVGAGDTLELEGFDHTGTLDAATLALTSGGSIASGGELLMTAGCDTTTPCGASSTLNIMGGTLTNMGAITANAGSEGSSPSGRFIMGDLDNQGTVNADVTVSVRGTGSQVTNDTGGSITNNAGTGDLLMSNGTTFAEGAGTTSPNTANPAHPAVVIDSGFNTPTPTLQYTGSGASTIASRATTNLQGNLASGQNLVIDPGSGCSGASQVTAAIGFTNAGTITLSGSCDSGLILTSGTLTNTGSLHMQNSGANTSELKGSLTNSGTFDVNDGTSFDKSGATLKQTAGTTTIANGDTLDSGPSGATFQLQGGVLTGGGHTEATAAVVNGPVSNTGGNIIPGSTGVPGIMTVGGNYTQGSGGKLSVVVNGAASAGVGKAYSQLSSGGNMTLGGTLAITTTATPTVNDFDTIAGASGTRSGTFSTVTGLFTPGSTFGYRASYGSTYAALQVGAALKVNKAGTGTGTVTSSPAGISCGSQCNAPFFQLAHVTLTAHPGSGSGFQSWSGVSGCGQASTCTVSMTQARTVTASFGHATTTTLASSANPAHVNKSVTYTATVAPKPGGGTVKFTDNGKTITGCGAVALSASTGKATCKITYKSKGTHSIVATYSGHATFAHSTSSKLTETVKT